jgi:hypothetical protein
MTEWGNIFNIFFWGGVASQRMLLNEMPNQAIYGFRALGVKSKGLCLHSNGVLGTNTEIGNRFTRKPNCG